MTFTFRRTSLHVALQIVTWGSILAAMLGLVVVLSASSEWNPQLVALRPHIYIVSVTAAAAFAVTLIVAAGSLSLRDSRLFFVALALLSMAGLFLVHGLATPGFLIEAEHYQAADHLTGYYAGEHTVSEYDSAYHSVTVGLSARLALLVGAFFIALSTTDLPGSLRYWIGRRMGWLYAIMGATLAMYGTIGLAGHELLERLPLSDSVLNWPVAVITLALLSAAGYRTVRSYLVSQLPMQGAFIIAIALLIEATVALAVSSVWSLSWWLYHAFLLLGFLAVLYVAASLYVRGRSVRDIVQQLALGDILEEVKRSYDQTALALATAAEARDSYTFEHIGRVAELALLIGRELRLPPDQLRTLAQGAILHDIGKLYTSDTVLRKPATLTPDEFDLIKQHPVQGYELLKRLRGFEREALIVRHHHEWYDGSGYPDGLRGKEIPLEARIVAVADVYDALTTERPYRRALSQQEAIDQIMKETGSHLDPVCVDAFMRAMAGQETEPIGPLLADQQA